MIHECVRLLPVLHHVKQQSPIMRPRGLCRAKTVLTTWIGISFIQFIPCKPSQPGKVYLTWRSILIHLLGIWKHGRMLQRKENLLNLSTQAEKHCVKLSQSHKMLMKPSTSSLISCNLGLWEDMLMQDEAASCIDHPSISIASLLVCVTPNLHRACTRRRTCLRCHWDTRRAKRRHKRSCKVGSSKVWSLISTLLINTYCTYYNLYMVYRCLQSSHPSLNWTLEYSINGSYQPSSMHPMFDTTTRIQPFRTSITNTTRYKHDIQQNTSRS